MRRPARLNKANKSWTPVRKSNVFCSPACGGGARTCSQEKFDLAKKRAEELAELMGPGWEPIVYENLGWHYRVECGLLEVISPYKPGGSYTAWVQTRPQYSAHHADPRVAMRDAIRAMDAAIIRLKAHRETVAEDAARGLGIALTGTTIDLAETRIS